MTDDLRWRPTVIEWTGGRHGQEFADHASGLGDIEERLVAAKALLFRGFPQVVEDLESAIDLVLPNRLSYLHGNTPRSKVGGNLYTSTEYPPEYTIYLHNELSYTHTWPTRLAFYCEYPAPVGGATPLVDGERWLAALDEQVRCAFGQGVRYTQNLHGGRGFGKSWQATFETDDRDQVAEFLGRDDVEWEWKKDGGLRISQVRPSTTRHPVTGAEVWFNQADQWHPAAGLDERTAAALAALLPPEDFPQAVSLADGSPIPAEWAVHIRDRGLEAAVDVQWQAGDLLLIDNVQVAHGRRPFSGKRRVLVAMSGEQFTSAGSGSGPTGVS